MKGKHDFIKGRHFYICGEEFDTENCMVLNFSEPLLYYFKKGYEIIKTDRYTLRPKENQIIQFPERKPTLCKILHNKKGSQQRLPLIHYNALSIFNTISFEFSAASTTNSS